MTERTTFTRRGALAAVGATVLGATTALLPSSAQAAERRWVTLGPVSRVKPGKAWLFGTKGIIVTQPTRGDYSGFRARCTHQRCAQAYVGLGRSACGDTSRVPRVKVRVRGGKVQAFA